MEIGDTVKFIDGLYADEEGARYKVMKINGDKALIEFICELPIPQQSVAKPAEPGLRLKTPRSLFPSSHIFVWVSVFLFPNLFAYHCVYLMWVLTSILENFMDDLKAIRLLKSGDLSGLEALMERYQVKAARA